MVVDVAWMPRGCRMDAAWTGARAMLVGGCGGGARGARGA